MSCYRTGNPSAGRATDRHSASTSNAALPIRRPKWPSRERRRRQDNTPASNVPGPRAASLDQPRQSLEQARLQRLLVRHLQRGRLLFVSIQIPRCVPCQQVFNCLLDHGLRQRSTQHIHPIALAVQQQDCRSPNDPVLFGQFLAICPDYIDIDHVKLPSVLPPDPIHDGRYLFATHSEICAKVRQRRAVAWRSKPERTDQVCCRCQHGQQQTTDDQKAPSFHSYSSPANQLSNQPTNYPRYPSCRAAASIATVVIRSTGNSIARFVSRRSIVFR